MTLDEAKQLIEQAEPLLNGSPFVAVHVFQRNDKELTLAITDRLRQSCKKARVWKSKPMLTAIKNAEYGFDQNYTRSSGGSDGIFILTRDHQPANQMMKKLFDKFIDKPGSEAQAIADELHTPLNSLVPVRLVSHHLRLLGVLKSSSEGDTLVLVDFDNTK